MPISLQQSNALDAYYVDRIAELKFRLRHECYPVTECHGVYRERYSELTACGEDAANELHRIQRERDDLEMIETCDDEMIFTGTGFYIPAAHEPATKEATA